VEQPRRKKRPSVNGIKDYRNCEGQNSKKKLRRKNGRRVKRDLSGGERAVGQIPIDFQTKMSLRGSDLVPGYTIRKRDVEGKENIAKKVRQAGVVVNALKSRRQRHM